MFSGLNKIFGQLYVIVPLAIVAILFLVNGFIIKKSFLVFLCIYLLPVLPTLLDSDLLISEKTYSIGRYSFCLLALIPFHFKKNKVDYKYFENIFVVIVIIGGVSLLYQIIFGPIYGLAEPGERVGLVRYSTLMGSITVFSVAQPLALGLILKNQLGLKRNIMIFIIVLLGILSLSKTVLAGDLIIFLVYSLSNLKFNAKFIIKTFQSISLFFLIGFLISLLIRGTIIQEYVQNVFEYSKVVFGFDVNANNVAQSESISENSSTRFLEYSIPSMNALYRDIGVFGFVFGGGLFYLGNAVLPFSESNIDMPHINYIDFLVSGGVCMMLIMIYFIVKKIILIISTKNYEYFPVYFFIVFVLFTSSSFHFHPASSIIFYLFFFNVNKIKV